MERIFEDEFTDLQADYISLCLEFTEKKVDEIYVYIYRNDGMRMFNAFFTKNGKFVSTADIADDDFVYEFLDVGMDDIHKFVELCEEFGKPCPNEFKLIYNVNSGSFDADYGYEDYSINGKTSGMEEFEAWADEIQAQLKN